MSNYKIEDNVKTPPLSRGQPLKYPFDKMDIGQSFLVPILEDPTGMKTRSAASSYGRRHPECSFRVSSEKSGANSGWRVWRVGGGDGKVPRYPKNFSEEDIAEMEQARKSGQPPAAVELEDSGQAEYEKQQAEDAEEEKTRLEVEVDEWEASGKVGPLLEMAAENGDVPVAEYVASFKSGGARLKVKRSKKEVSK